MDNQYEFTLKHELKASDAQDLYSQFNRLLKQDIDIVINASEVHSCDTLILQLLLCLQKQNQYKSKVQIKNPSSALKSQFDLLGFVDLVS